MEWNAGRWLCGGAPTCWGACHIMACTSCHMTRPAGKEGITMERRAPLVVSAALVASLGLGLTGLAASPALASEGGSTDLSGLLGRLAQTEVATPVDPEDTPDATADEEASADEAALEASTAGTEADGLAAIKSGLLGGDHASAAKSAPTASSSVADSSASSQPAKLSDDPYAMQFEFDGSVIQLPCAVADLMDLGFTLDEEDAGDVLEDGYTASVTMNFGDPDDYIYVICSIYNNSGSEKPFEECMIDDVYLMAGSLEGHTVVTPGGIMLGVSTREDVEAIYGPAEDPYEDGDYVALGYDKTGDYRDSMDFTIVDGVLYEIDIHSSGEYQVSQAAAAARDDADDAEAAGTTTATGPVERVSPEIAELSSDPYSYQFSLDGVNFQLPCYVADLQAAGFMLEADEAGDILEDGYQTSTSMYYGDPDDYVYVTVTICNVSGSELPLSECMVCGLSFNERTLGEAGHTVEIPGGIVLGTSTEDEVMAALGEPVYAWESDDGTATSYDFQASPDDFYNSISLWFDEGVLTEISLSVTPM